MAHPNVFGVKCYCIVTGASRGIGRAIAISLAKKISTDSVIVLTGRSEADLSETQSQIEAAAAGVRVGTVTADLSAQGTLPTVLAELTSMKDAPAATGVFQHCLLINNAGSLWDVSKFLRDVTPSDLESLQNFCMLNLTSFLLLTAHFLRSFPKRDGLQRTIVNITSLGAIQPMKTCGVYCMGKAAREMLLKTLAVEDPDVRVLNYAPGPVNTDMLQTICESSADQEIKDTFQGLVTKKIALAPDQTAAKLARILEEDTYESGAHIDYFDVSE